MSLHSLRRNLKLLTLSTVVPLIEIGLVSILLSLPKVHNHSTGQEKAEHVALKSQDEGCGGAYPHSQGSTWKEVYNLITEGLELRE